MKEKRHSSAILESAVSKKRIKRQVASFTKTRTLTRPKEIEVVLEKRWASFAELRVVDMRKERPVRCAL